MSTFEELGTGPPRGPDMFEQRALNWELWAEKDGYRFIDLPLDFEAMVREAIGLEPAENRLERCFLGFNRLKYLKPGTTAASDFLDRERKKLSAALVIRRRAQLRVVVSNILLALLVGGVTAGGTVILERLLA